MLGQNVYPPFDKKMPKSLAKNLPPPKTFFFSQENIHFLTYIQPHMAHLKITFWIFFLTGCLRYWPQKGLKRTFCARTFQGLHSVRLWKPTI
jgi:hypothetical protein